jgi:hypothetical protein
MKTKTIYTILCVSLLTQIASVHAADVGVQADVKVEAGEHPRMEARKEMRLENHEDRKEFRNDRMMRKDDIEDERYATSPEARKEMRAEMKNTNDEKKSELKVKIDARKDELKKKIEGMKADKKDEKTKKLDEQAKERVIGHLTNIYDRLYTRITRLTKVDAEITRRLATRSPEPAVLVLHASAQSLLAQAKVDVEATKAASAAELTTTTSKEALRSLVTTAETSIKNAGEAYKKVVQALKETPKAEVSASPSSSIQ